MSRRSLARGGVSDDAAARPAQFRSSAKLPSNPRAADRSRATRRLALRDAAMPSSFTTPIQLRPGRADDADTIRALTREAYAPWVSLIGREPLPMTADYDAALREHRFNLTFRSGELVGLIETTAAPEHLLVVNVAVAPSLQSAGLGRRLLAHAEALAREQGLTTLRLYTNARFKRNISICQRLGYAVEREETSERGVTWSRPSTRRRVGCCSCRAPGPIPASGDRSASGCRRPGTSTISAGRAWAISRRTRR
jgi:GNAT superfamily N-acetyltransferase